MPRELSAAEERAFARYEALGTPDELQKLAQENEKLKTENAERRKDNKTLTEERDAALAKIPDGAVVLTGDEAKAAETLKVSGVALADVPRVVEELDKLKSDVAKRDRSDNLGKAFETENWNPKARGIVLKILGEAPLEIKDEDVEVQESGKPVRKKMPVGYVTVDGKPVRLSEWAKTEDGLVELLAGGTNSNGGTGGGTGRPAPEQFGGGGKTPGKPTEEDVKKSTARTADYIL